MTVPRWIIPDSQTTEVAGFDLNWLPSAAYSYLKPHVLSTSPRDAIVALETGPYVGTIPLRNGETLYIVPRIGGKSLSRMIAVAEGLEDNIRDEFFDPVEYGVDAGALSWAHLLARSLLDRLQEIEREGLRTHRVRRLRRADSLRGIPIVVPTTLNVLTRRDRPIVSSAQEKTTDIPEHRVLAAAGATVLQMGLATGAGRATAVRWQQRFGTSRLRREDLVEVVEGLNTKRYHGARSYYIPALVAARLILGSGGMDLETDWRVKGEPLLLNVYNLFERYIRRTIRMHLQHDDFVVAKYETGVRSLFEDGSIEMTPDIEVSKFGTTFLLADVKYKPDGPLPASDHYQMASYLSAYGIERGVLIYPHDDSGQLLTHRKLVAGGRIYELRIPLVSMDAAEEGLIGGIRQVLAD